DRHGRHRVGIREDGQGRRAALGGGPMTQTVLTKDAIRVERVVTSGTFSLDGGTWEVDNNVWLVGDDDDVIVIDAAHDAEPILDAVAGRRLTGVLCTHGHDDHISAV